LFASVGFITLSSFEPPPSFASDTQLLTLRCVRPLLVHVFCESAHVAMGSGQAPQKVLLVCILREKQKCGTSRPTLPRTESRRKKNRVGAHTRSRTDVFKNPYRAPTLRELKQNHKRASWMAKFMTKLTMLDYSYEPHCWHLLPKNLSTAQATQGSVLQLPLLTSKYRKKKKITLNLTTSSKLTI